MFHRFDLKNQVLPFSRCMECNGLLEDVPKKDILNHLLPKTREYYQEFKKCCYCDVFIGRGHIIKV